MFNCPWCGALIGVPELVTPVSLGVTRFELCVSQKCCDNADSPNVLRGASCH